MLKPRDNYLEEILNYGKPCRWNKPIVTVYIDTETVYQYKREEAVFKTYAAFNEWYKVLNGKLKFEYIDNEKNADILVQFQRNECAGEIGICYYTKIAKNGAYQRMDVCIGLIYSHLFMQDAMHEIGHALGLMGHSTVSTDLMYRSVSYNNLKLSKRDINTLRLLYSMPLEGEKYSIFAESLNENLIEINNEEYICDNSLDIISDENRDLEIECKNIGNVNLYKMELNNIQIKNKYTKPYKY